MKEPRGTPIAGSLFVRDYCFRCGEPIRVRTSDIGQINYCEQHGHQHWWHRAGAVWVPPLFTEGQTEEHR